MSVMENLIKQNISQTIKKAMIDSKYTDEPISFGQAVVTHHFVSQLQQ